MTSTANIENRARVIVLLKDIDQIAMQELRFAETMSRDITAFCVVNDEDAEMALNTRWHEICIGIPLVIRNKPDRRVVEPLLEYIQSTEFGYQPGCEITVILSRYDVSKWWQKLLHNGASIAIERQLLKHKYINVVVLPFQLISNNVALMKS
jgi:hypothetical protein